MNMRNSVIIKYLPRTPYEHVWHDMRAFTIERTESSIDEIWFTEHEAVFTQGQAGKPEHILHTNNIPVIQSDRGGQVTYHGEGQILAYILCDIKQKELGIRTFVSTLENSIINLLTEEFNLISHSDCKAPGVYINNKKICSIGLRVKNGCTYHGLSFNVDMDLKPFSYINPCGYSNLEMTQLKDYVPNITIESLLPKLEYHLCKNLGYTNIHEY